jgi:hypothetical protein
MVEVTLTSKAPLGTLKVQAPKREFKTGDSTARFSFSVKIAWLVKSIIAIKFPLFTAAYTTKYKIFLTLE